MTNGPMSNMREITILEKIDKTSGRKNLTITERIPLPDGQAVAVKRNAYRVRRYVNKDSEELFEKIDILQTFQRPERTYFTTSDVSRVYRRIGSFFIQEGAAFYFVTFSQTIRFEKFREGVSVNCN